jgi:IrrE N-terminal-like domain
MKRYWRRAEVEHYAWRTLQEFERRHGSPLSLPVDVDLIGELVFGLTWDWDTIPEPPGRVIWAGLVPRERRVVMNERHLEAYRRNEGLERFTKAHELGHWACHVLHGLPGGAGLVCSAARQWLERHADWFAASLLMPAPLLIPAARRLDLERWPERYALRDRFNVSITALNRRLAHLRIAASTRQPEGESSTTSRVLGAR